VSTELLSYTLIRARCGLYRWKYKQLKLSLSTAMQQTLINPIPLVQNLTILQSKPRSCLVCVVYQFKLLVLQCHEPWLGQILSGSIILVGWELSLGTTHMQTP
jgi:hypothetical protein